ncbi:MAG: S-layer homology domain-containing protein, partial [Bacillota bacterium]|nr:S-layer homology domain-containing protein [Bacillota bacterium]
AQSFSDVPAGQWYSEAVKWAASAGIVSGYDANTFGPNDMVTREQLASILYRYAVYKKYDVSVGEDTNILSYSDAFEISSWAISPMQWACGMGLIEGIADGNSMKLDGQGSAVRSQVATILQRFCSAYAK